ncbi:hypothetical protein V8C42DRAFT_349358 [Trichoderma barbatum]
MSFKPRKRSLLAPDGAAPPDVTDQNRADCPFTVTVVSEPERSKFKTSQSLKLYYAVDPRKQWFDMTRYNSFILNGVKYYTEDFVYVANKATVERQNSPPTGATKVAKKADYWVARILEVRASNEHHTARGKSLVASHTMDSMSWSPI